MRDDATPGLDQGELVLLTEGQVCCDNPWEQAYLRFETPEQEMSKFLRRLEGLGAPFWPRDAAIVELFCGRGNGLRALERLGFTHIEGVDLSATLLAQYRGPARCYVADCRDLPLADGSKDIVVVQGGLHHLPELPGDLERTLAEIHRLLRPGGLAMIVEPWMTPFLGLVNVACGSHLARRLWDKLDALAVMTEHERSTYEAWLGQPRMILEALDRHFEPVVMQRSWGKLRYLGQKRPTTS